MITEHELREKYWYKHELVQLCKDYKIPHSGTKAALIARLHEYLKTGVIPQPIPKTRRKTDRTSEITLDTYFLQEGLRFNQELRTFFCRTLGKQTVKFSKHMGTAVRNAEQQGKDITVRELLNIWQHPPKQPFETAEDKTYQWNRFVKDFHCSERSTLYRHPLKVAAILWRFVRKSREEKVYTDELLDRYQDNIKAYLKNF
jgi:SAP domain-containing protein